MPARSPKPLKSPGTSVLTTVADYTQDISSPHFRGLVVVGRTRMTSKQAIIAEIQGIAAENGGRAPGLGLFRSTTRMSDHAWKGRYWSKWSDALVEAGFAPNELDTAYSDEELLLAYASVARRHGRLPTEPEYKLAAREDCQSSKSQCFQTVGS